MEYAEKAEIAYEAYKGCLDLEIAYLRAGLSDIERTLIENDVDFKARIQLVVYDEQERLITNLRDLSHSYNENIKLTATLKLGSMMYSERFREPTKAEEKPAEQKVPTTIVLTGPDK